MEHAQYKYQNIIIIIIKVLKVPHFFLAHALKALYGRLEHLCVANLRLRVCLTDYARVSKFVTPSTSMPSRKTDPNRKITTSFPAASRDLLC